MSQYCGCAEDHEVVLRRYAADEGGANLDCVPQDDLMVIWHAIYTHPVRAARILWPTRPAGYVRVVRLYGAYASNKATAMRCRINGDIDAAQVYEDICEHIYRSMEEYARW